MNGMAKDDYDTLVFIILAFLYKRLKGKTEDRPAEYIQPMTKDFPIQEDYLNYVLVKMLEEGFIERLEVSEVWGGDSIVKVTDQLRITPDGIHYLRDNSTMRKLSKLLPQAAAIASLFEEI